MAKPNKAQITYLVGEATSTLRFHAVMAEEHEASSRVTKFPIQSGFEVSNHAITENRKISIRGIVSNSVVFGAEEAHIYGGNNSRVMFDTLNKLVKQKKLCDVITNYGNYEDVLFTKLRTKLEAGKTDVMEFILSGEELQLGTTVNNTTPTLLVFTPLTVAQRAAEVDRLASVGITVPEFAKVTRASVDISESFQIQTAGLNGKTNISTWEVESYDPTTKMYSHTIHTSDIEVAGATEETGINWFEMMQEEAGVDLEAGASTTIACVADGLVGFGTDIVEGQINTALGLLNKSIYGAIVGIQSLGGDSELGQLLMSLGVDCLIAGAIGSVDETLNEEDYQDNTIPTWDEAVAGAARRGDSVATGALRKAAPTTITKISPPNSNLTFFGDLI